MNAPRTLPLQGTLLHWGGLLTLVLAIIGGILGMHVLAGAQAGTIGPAHTMSASSGTTAEATVAAAPAAAHPTASPVPPSVDHAASSAVSGHQGSMAVCGCSPSACDMSMASHGACVPFAGSATPAAPQPGLVPDPATGPITMGHAKPKPADLFSNAPSLTQLSISRT